MPNEINTIETQEENILRCSNCNNIFIDEDLFNSPFNNRRDCNNIFIDEDLPFNNRRYCNDCYTNRYFACDCCGSNGLRDDSFYDDDTGYNYCESCYNDRHPQENEDNNHFKIINIPFKKIKSKSYKINQYKNFCGLEIETQNINLNKNTFNSEELKKFNFSQIEDGSVNSGCEYVSLALNGDELYKNIEVFCDELKKRNFYVSSCCGLHIHIDINHKWEYLKKVILFYNKYEDFFFKLTSNSRQNNHFCNRLKNIYPEIIQDIDKIKNTTQLKQKLYGTSYYNAIKNFVKQKYHNKRYSWLNLHSLFYHGTIEIRLHNGTINKEKIKEWFNIHLTILNLIEHLNENTIKNLPKTEEFFISIFKPSTQEYILNRWAKFSKLDTEEEND